MINKIGIFSITLDRLYYTCHCFKRLKTLAGSPYEHIIIDNGSKDGTHEWLQEEGYNVIKNEENKGITHASVQGFRWLREKGVNLIIKMDSDCELLTVDTLLKIDAFFGEDGKEYIVSPIVRGIDTVPDVIASEVVNSFRLNRTKHIGGIFRAMRLDTFADAMVKCKTLNDAVLNDYFRQVSLKTGYIQDLEVNHFETTKGQEKRYPKYFDKKYIY